MGLSNRLHDVSGDSLLLLVVAAAASLLYHLRLLLLPPAPTPTPTPTPIAISLSSLVAIADHIPSSSSSAAAVSSSDCAVCLCAMAGGDRVRRLSCRHAFHAACIDGWLLLSPPAAALPCPLCRSPAARPDPDADRRIAADLVACLSHF
uniref:RING-type domain-containing protein n=1 Tax=Ananas comosus var. bracteatus TaxID=296719 RepID=A0A6V7Q4X7_ANACO|nr:unnamed protein product [Ananas comosus var. bracteatus]